MLPFRSAFLACLLTSAMAADPLAEPAASVTGWIKALQANDLTTAWDRLPEAQRLSWAKHLVTPAVPDVGGGQRGARGMRGGNPADGLFRMLAEGDVAQHGGRILAATLAAFAGTVTVDGKTPPSASLPTDQPFLAFMPRMAAAGALGGVVQNLLASGQETQQITAIDTWATAYADWAKTAPFSDEQRAAAAQPHVQAFAVAVRAVPAGSDARSVLLGWSAGLPRLKQALAVYGLDADAAFASATVEAQPAAVDGSVVVTVRFPAFSALHSLPLKLRAADGGWEIAADSPALRWLRGGLSGGSLPMLGRMMDLGGQRRRPAAQPPADPPADVPTKQDPVGF